MANITEADVASARAFARRSTRKKHRGLIDAKSATLKPSNQDQRAE